MSDWNQPSRPASLFRRAKGTGSRNTNFERLLRNAISGNWLVEIRHPDWKGWRAFAPHALISVAGAPERFAAFDAAMGHTDQEQLFDVSRLLGLRLLERTFEPHPDFHRDNALYERGVICSV